ncbi:MAG: hypothetical protein WCS94_21260 [Verrucomicrobiota bacterium]
MKFSGKYFGFAAVVLAFAGNIGYSESPYAQVGARNVFGLNPPAVPAAAIIQPEQLPRITPNGIISIFGNIQTLFKVTDNRPGLPAFEQAYILAEGQREGDVEVIKIDAKNAVITFNNHGTIQTIPILVAKISSGNKDASGNNPLAAAPASPAFNANRFMGPAGLALRNQLLKTSQSDNATPAEIGESYAGSPLKINASSQGAEVVNSSGSIDAGNPTSRKSRNLINWDLIGEQMVMIARERM